MFRKIRRRFTGELSPPAYLAVKLGVVLSCLILVAALALLVRAGPLNAHNVHTHRLVADLYRAPQGVLLVSFLGALIIEDRLKGG